MSSEEKIGPRITDRVSTVAWKYDQEGGPYAQEVVVAVHLIRPLKRGRRIRKTNSLISSKITTTTTNKAGTFPPVCLLVNPQTVLES